MSDYLTPNQISVSVVIDHYDFQKSALSDHELTKFAQSKLARALAEGILKREDIFSRKEAHQGVTFSAEFYCLTGEQLNQIVYNVTQDIGYRVLGSRRPTNTTQEDN